ncbi:oligosaccharide flippase family protein [Microbacterium sp. EYE_5]|uniref:oligosaccharide flippase family protein n=1 Tax=unclassified Microbacterium TaxID=2609290 RepID=UPI002005D818|nr:MULTISPECIES: oligosaccharide flippase family protein [unclassified Microbacterium]MCK6079045.1 oligosaccharide flippase family protein [Microbacterium sp. EYE_382]MCK6084315.1 oligosaccharide flippase family protein [Microbacterium sp. EYE_384]MCK6123456.1 oligosaccharide flippase family protein [Microbacterium sp. EYE_80]MCK6125079.1 oligosaccharide flippase family protein [Microbacterium sp. EYE_79]MCK6139999.1 oligosaccharide flippase family protein [Microbacterium sp. EYE_39]
MIRQLSGVFGWKLFASAASFVCNLAITRILLENYGVSQYAAISVLLSLPALIPFADLGLGSVAVNAAADLKDGRAIQEARRSLSAVLRLLAVSGLVIMVAAVLLLASGAWPSLLGPAVADVSTVGIGATIALCLVGVNVVIALAGRILQGWRRNALMIALSVVGPPLSLVLVVLFVGAGTDPGLMAVPASISLVVVSLLTWVAVARIDPATVKLALRTTPRRGDFSDALQIGAGGMLVAILVALLMQADRLSLSFLASPEALAAYALVAPIYLAGWALLNPLAMNLWPVYRQEISDGTFTRRRLLRDVGLFAAIGGMAGCALFVGGPIAVSLVAGSNADIVPLSVYVGFALLLLLQGAALPAAMVLTDKKGFRYQPIPFALAVILKAVSLPYCVAVAGPAGPIFASVFGILVGQFPLMLRKASQRATAGEEDLDDEAR